MSIINPSSLIGVGVSALMGAAKSTPAGAAAASVLDQVSGGSAVDAFMKYASQTPAERMQEAMLKRLGLTKDQLNAMDPKQREAVENQIREMIKQQVEAETGGAGKKGVLADIKV